MNNYPGIFEQNQEMFDYKLLSL